MTADDDRIVALSISDGPDLARFGYLKVHIRQVLSELLVTLLRDGLRIGYGGDLRQDGYTRDLFEALSAAYARNRLIPSVRPAIVHYFAFSSWRHVEPTQLGQHLKQLGTTAETRFFDPAGEHLAVFFTDDGFRRVASSSGHTEPIAEPDYLALLNSMRVAGETLETGDALTAMRRSMAKDTILRVLASGKVVGYQGRMPGIVEEAVLHAEAERLVVPLGAFGGASRDVAIALGLLPDDARVGYAETGQTYYRALAEIARLAHSHRERAERAGAWSDLQLLAQADDPIAIAAGVLRLTERVGRHDRTS